MEEANIIPLRRCPTCREMFRGAGRYCRRIMAEFLSFNLLRSILERAHFSGWAERQERLRKEYLLSRMRQAVEQLPTCEDSLAEVLAEIVEML
jgi:hypothetical protein